jgi:tetratricopeptide (TPR) repeat protein
MLQPSDSICEAKRLYRLARIPAAIELLETLPPTSARNLLLLRCLTEQGKFAQASALTNELPTSNTPEIAETQEFYLRQAFLQACHTGNTSQLISLCNETLTNPQPHPSIKALVHDLQGRSTTLMIILGNAPPSMLIQSTNNLIDAVQAFMQVGDLEAALSSLMQLGHTYLLSIPPDPKIAQAFFEQAHDQAANTQHFAYQAEALLRLAELHFDETLSQPNFEPNQLLEFHLYEKALNLYKSIEHALGIASTLLSFGSRLTNFGFDGTEQLHQALQIYQQQDNHQGIFKVLTELSGWHLKQGQVVESFNYRQQALEIAKVMGSPLCQSTTYLALADYYFRTAAYAQALANYEQVLAQFNFPNLWVTTQFGLANTYTQMNLPFRAAKACEQVITFLQPKGASPSLSLAYEILGNSLNAKKQWQAAIAAWQASRELDQVLQDPVKQAEKLGYVAQATILRHYCSEGGSIPEVDYVAGMQLFEQAITSLEEIKTPQAAAALAETFQLRGQVFATCGRFHDAISDLENARNTYAAINYEMQTAITDTLIGLLCHKLIQSANSELFDNARAYYQLALAYFQKSNMREVTWKVNYYIADIAFLQGFQAPSAEEQTNLWHEAAAWLQAADKDINFVRRGWVGNDPIEREILRLGLVANKEKLYNFAIRLTHKHLCDNRTAFNWLEQFKGRVFVDGLATTVLRPPVLVDPTLHQREQSLLAALNQAPSQTVALELNEQLNGIWQQLATYPEASEYVALRQAQPLCWETLQAILQE